MSIIEKSLSMNMKNSSLQNEIFPVIFQIILRNSKFELL